MLATPKETPGTGICHLINKGKRLRIAVVDIMALVLEGGCAMPERILRADRYRRYAEELRTMADGWQDPATIQKVTTLASDWEAMADRLERSAKGDGIGISLE